ncbi:hypothetical protein T05_2952, partial [Trichinella murrelli]
LHRNVIITLLKVLKVNSCSLRTLFQNNRNSSKYLSGYHQCN